MARPTSRVPQGAPSDTSDESSGDTARRTGSRRRSGGDGDGGSDRRDGGNRRGDGGDQSALNISELEQLPREELIEFALERDIEDAASLQPQELIFRVLQDQAERRGNIFSGGVFTLVDDGFGFLRGERLIPGPNDIYVSQSQIRRFGLRSGDYVTGQVRQPKDREKYYSLLRVDAVNGLDPEAAKRRPDFDS
ncbi:MAG: Rho termination factor N-terminal domain-containing protein, partial [Chloroflexi bacterium]|nr:Rho termination factor N-terminal domain-containing protein [Chloroflexota bacterium]